MRKPIIAVGALLLGTLSFIAGTLSSMHLPNDAAVRDGGWEAVFAPPTVEEAPPGLRASVRAGHQILMFTREKAPAYVGASNRLSCRSCHFYAGQVESTISLVGVAARYPTADPSGGGVVTLEDKIRSCFRVNLGGTPPPPGSAESRAVQAYLHWISSGIPIQATVPWLGLPPLTVPREPDVTSGEKLFGTICSRCHGPTGGGTALAPPLIGEAGFTSASPMAELPMLASFVYRYMPYGNPGLTPEDAWDVAAFLLASPRPEPPPR